MKHVFLSSFLFALFVASGCVGGDLLLKIAVDQTPDYDSYLTGTVFFSLVSVFLIALVGGILGLVLVASLRPLLRPSPVQKAIVCAACTFGLVLFGEYLATGSITSYNSRFGYLESWLLAFVVAASVVSHRLLRGKPALPQ